MRPSREDWQHVAIIATMMADTYSQPRQSAWRESIELVAAYLGFEPMSLDDAVAELSSRELGYE